MGKIRHLRLLRLGERESGLGRDELAVLLGEGAPVEKAAPACPQAAPRQRPEKKQRGDTR